MKHSYYRVTVMVCGILPRDQNLHHNGRRLSSDFLMKVNEVAAEVNRCLRRVEQNVPWMKFVDIPGFISSSGINRSLLARDGLHLSYKGTDHTVKVIESAVQLQLKVRERLRCRLNSMLQPTEPETTTVHSSSELSQPIVGPKLYSEVVKTSRILT